ncbi:hypothetical protein B0J17DRAFT_633563 [Rhizoctonia solani]|nr:hypothetical protein B0J17DRAFT_633563 [Rhizoctonia solani]
MDRRKHIPTFQNYRKPANVAVFAARYFSGTICMSLSPTMPAPLRRGRYIYRRLLFNLMTTTSSLGEVQTALLDKRLILFQYQWLHHHLMFMLVHLVFAVESLVDFAQNDWEPLKRDSTASTKLSIVDDALKLINGAGQNKSTSQPLPTLQTIHRNKHRGFISSLASYANHGPISLAIKPQIFDNLIMGVILIPSNL